VAIRSDGNIYFSDTIYQAPSPAPQPQTHLYRVAPTSNGVSVIDPNQQSANGVTLSVDERALYVTAQNGVYRYPVADDGSVAAGTVFTSAVGMGDGMAIDCAGNLYVATNANIVVLNPQGGELFRITFTNVQTVTNAAFGGPERKTLYVTTLGSQMQKALFKIDLTVPGLPY
jgi:gluconolactonase